MDIINVENITKEFQILQRQKGLSASIKSLFNRAYVTKTAVNDVSFTIKKGELIGYLGPNGSGKSTTIKMLSGILVPSSGVVKINGQDPTKNRKANARKIGVVFGQRSQLYWNLPMEETFDLYRKIYNVDDEPFKQNVAFYVELLDMKEFLRTPVRQLSLGQRMRAELVVSLLHDPEILYLDEPTIGLDVIAKQKIREFIREINAKKQTTVILTTHDMDDVEQICNRIITIDKGRLLYDGTLQNFKETYAQNSMLIVEFMDTRARILDHRLTVAKVEGNQQWISFNSREISNAQAITSITTQYEIKDIQMIEPKLEDAIKKIYSGK